MKLRELWHAAIHGPFPVEKPMFPDCSRCRTIYGLPEKKQFLSLEDLTVFKGECSCGAEYMFASTSDQWALEEEEKWRAEHQGTGHGVKV